MNQDINNALLQSNLSTPPSLILLQARFHTRFLSGGRVQRLQEPLLDNACRTYTWLQLSPW